MTSWVPGLVTKMNKHDPALPESLENNYRVLVLGDCLLAFCVSNEQSHRMSLLKTIFSRISAYIMNSLKR